MGAQHQPVQPYLIEPKMEQLLHDYAESDEHTITKLARFHIEFEGIHPFIDIMRTQVKDCVAYG